MNTNHEPLTIIFFGRSGSGKGTQAELLIKSLQAEGKKTLYIETGRAFRAFVEESNLTAKLTKTSMDKGEFLPEFMPVWLWSDQLVRKFDGTQDMILDGLARRMHEAPILDSALKFYGRTTVHVVHMNVSREWSKTRLLSRGRGDDQSEDQISKRLDSYDREVMPVLDYFKEKKGYVFHDINGERTIEEIHNDILVSLSQA